MRFSILIPVYNVQKYLRKCLHSIVSQSFTNFEVILVNDGSTDDSVKICNEFAQKYSFVKLINKANEGLISARRVALLNAQGEYFLFCDSDDFFEPDALSSLNSTIIASQADLVLFNANVVRDGQKKIFFQHVLPTGMQTDKKEVYDLLLTTYKINALCLKAFKREIVDVHRDYSKFYPYNFGEDLLQTIPLVKAAASIYYLDKPLYNYRVDSGMMRHYSPKFYESYHVVNRAVSTEMDDCKIMDIDQKLSVHLLRAAYGATTQVKYLITGQKDALIEISQDADFRMDFKNLGFLSVLRYFNLKQTLILSLLYWRQYSIIVTVLNLKG